MLLPMVEAGTHYAGECCATPPPSAVSADALPRFATPCYADIAIFSPRQLYFH